MKRERARKKGAFKYRSRDFSCTSHHFDKGVICKRKITMEKRMKMFN